MTYFPGARLEMRMMPVSSVVKGEPGISVPSFLTMNFQPSRWLPVLVDFRISKAPTVSLL